MSETTMMNESELELYEAATRITHEMETIAARHSELKKQFAELIQGAPPIVTRALFADVLEYLARKTRAEGRDV